MGNLEIRRLGDLICLHRGISWDATQERDRPGKGTWPVLGIPNVQERLVLDRLVHLKLPTGTPAAARLASLGTILMVGSNGNPSRVGNVVYIDRDDGFLFASFLIGARKRDTAEADPKFLFHFIASPSVQDAISRSVRGTTGLQNLSQKFVEELKIPTPPLLEQRHIAAILDTVDDAIRKTEQIIAKLKQVKQGLLHDLLTRGMDGNGELRDPERHPEQFKDSPLGPIPNGWEVVVIRRLTTLLSYGFTNPMPTVDDGPWMLTAADIADGTVNWSTARKTSRGAFQRLLTPKSRPKPGDLLLTKDGTLGRIALLDRPDVCINQSVALLRFHDLWLRDLVFTYLRSPHGQERMLADAGGSTIRHIYISKLANMTVPKPPRQESEAIAAAVAGAERRFASEEAVLAKLRFVKAGMIEDLLTGRKRVTKLLETSGP